MTALSKPTSVLLVWLFHEIALKGNNRRRFLKAVQRNVRAALRGLHAQSVFVPPMSLRIHLPEDVVAEARERLQKVFGVEYISPALWTAASWEALLEATDVLLRRLPSFTTFAIRCRRTEKRFPMSSAQIEQQLGAYVAQRTGARVNLQEPERTFWVRLLPDGFYLSAERIPGLGGLPVGVSGRTLALLSGGIDSPVAAWRMMGRGCRVDFLHFHSFPLVSPRSQEKAQALVEMLVPYEYHTRLFLAPLAEFQQHVVVLAPPEYRVILYRRFMFRLAERLARRIGAQALITGESLGQVSSQTLQNLATIGAVVSMPILRPLIGMSKQEIIAQARQLGTYEISIQPDEDCCSLFVARHSATRSDPERIEALEAQLPLESLLEQALEQLKVLSFRFPAAARTSPPLDVPATAAASSPSDPELRESAP